MPGYFGGVDHACVNVGAPAVDCKAHTGLHIPSYASHTVPDAQHKNGCRSMVFGPSSQWLKRLIAAQQRDKGQPLPPLSQPDRCGARAFGELPCPARRPAWRLSWR